MKKQDIEKLRGQLFELNKAYREGNPQVSDAEYDRMVEELRETNPNDKFFESGVVEKASDRMEPLPVPMFSLEKAKTLDELRKWLSNIQKEGCKFIVCTPKYDGISLVVNETDGRAWTRGDGVRGQLSTEHFRKMNNGSAISTETNSVEPPGLLLTWGEAIVKKTEFSTLKAMKDFPYKNARNMVAGLFNSPDGYESPYISHVDYVRYGCNLRYRKGTVLSMLNHKYKNVAPYFTYSVDAFLDYSDDELDEMMDDMHEAFARIYRIDGIVLEVEEGSVRTRMGRLPNNNPAYAIAFKKAEWCDVYQTKVVSITGEISKSGAWKPVINVEPVEMEGATVSRATAYNASYLFANHICPGAVIEIVRSGDVIPKHISTVSYDPDEFNDFKERLRCPSCGEPLEWNESKVELICTNGKCSQKVMAEMSHWFRTMGCEGFDEPTLIRLRDELHLEGIPAFLDASADDFRQVLGELRGSYVYLALHRTLQAGVPLSRYLSALNIFGGHIAEATCQKILDALPPHMAQDLLSPVGLKNRKTEFLHDAIESIKETKGVGDVIREAFSKGMDRYMDIGIYDGVIISYVQTPKADVTVPDNQMVVCMTGFRDKELEQKLRAKGHLVVNSVTKECNVLVVADISSTSSKMKTAQKRGIRIVERKEFEKEMD